MIGLTAGALLLAAGLFVPLFFLPASGRTGRPAAGETPLLVVTPFKVDPNAPQRLRPCEGSPVQPAPAPFPLTPGDRPLHYQGHGLAAGLELELRPGPGASAQLRLQSPRHGTSQATVGLQELHDMLLSDRRFPTRFCVAGSDLVFDLYPAGEGLPVLFVANSGWAGSGGYRAGVAVDAVRLRELISAATAQPGN